jgi:hypothetical protein
MPTAEAWQPVPGSIAALPSNSVTPSNLVGPAASPAAARAPARTAPPAVDQAVRLAPLAGPAPHAPAPPAPWAEPDGAAPFPGGAEPDEEPAPLPEPVRLVVERAEPVPDLSVLAAEALRWLAVHEPAALTDWLVGGSWAEASARLAAVVGAWTRYGPAGDGSLAVDLRHAGMLDVVGRDQVGFVSRTTVHRRAQD